jgi:glutamyl-tRNA reductase
VSVVVVVGLNHASAPFDLLERVHVGDELRDKLLSELPSTNAIDETMILATCQRTEIYITAEWYHPAVDEVQAKLAQIGGVTVDEIAAHGFAYHGDQALKHLFRVAAGLDSPVIGESEVLGQLRHAAKVAKASGVMGSELNAAYRAAVAASRRARAALSADSIAPRPSLASAAVAMIADRLPADARVGVLGAGDVARSVLDALIGEDPSREVVQFNRSAAPGRRKVRARVSAHNLAELPEHLPSLDVVYCCTAADEPVVTESMLLGALAARGPGSLTLVDLAVPRDVEPSVAGMHDVHLLDVRDVSRFAGERFAPPARAIAAAEDSVEDAVDAYLAATSGRKVAPLVTALRTKVEQTRLAELERARALMSSLDESQREAVDVMTKALVAKLLHEPTVRLKDAAGSESGERLASSVRHLFDLDDR